MSFFTWKRRALLLTAVALTVAAGGTFAQIGKRKSPGSDICVAKSLADYEDAQYTTVQAAVNAARAGQVIEILDDGTYEEQVTIDGRDTSPWAGVTGGKNGITIRYVPTGGAAAAWNHPRPTIKYRDTQNTSPKNITEANKLGELVGSAGNYETNGALRVLWAKGVAIEGIAVDGGGPFSFGAAEVWCEGSGISRCSPLNHGNAAIALVVSGQVTIRDCDLKNAFFGMYVKDRNTGGVFGNPNPADGDNTIPLSGFGQVGGHLFEYSRINANVVGFFFESSWDLGSSVRYNLIYNNKRGNLATWSWVGDGANQKNGGAFMFKDMYLSPLAIYNNTLYDNSGNFIGQWQAGGQHLIFNNIFSKSTPSQNEGKDHMSLDGAFPLRMNNNVFSADPSRILSQCQTNFNCAANSEIAPGGCFVADIQGSTGDFVQIQGTPMSLAECNGPGTMTTRVVKPGALIPSVRLGSGITQITIPAANNIRWLQTEGGAVGMGMSGQTASLPTLFKSLTPTSADFLVPNWEDTLVKQFIKNKGWPDAGIRNTDGSIADLGAIPSTGIRQTTVARIIPTNVVTLSGGGANASASFSFRVDNGTINSPKIKMLRWIAPLPTNTLETEGTASPTAPTGGNWPNRLRPIASDAIRVITNTSTLNIGNNSLSFQTGKTTVPNYGFFEIIAEGTTANGTAVSSDVGFLPYRELGYFFDITVYDGATAVTTVQVGQSYRVHVEARKGDGTAYTGAVGEVSYSLLSDPTAYMRDAAGDTISSASNVAFPKNYDVYFSRAGAETIFASGFATVSSNRVAFLGTNAITVLPGAPAKAVFTDPIPLSQLGTASAPIINRGVDRPVTVEVQDRYGNPVDQAIQVTIVSDNTAVGDVGAPNNINTKTVATTTSGVAAFTARVTSGAIGQTFDMTATIPNVTQTDSDNKSRLRLGRSLDRLEVFYSDNEAGKQWATYWDPTVTINREAGEWEKITVKVVVSDTVNTGRPNQFVLVTSAEPNLIFSATEGGAPATVFALNSGVASFYVSTAPGATRDIVNAGITVYGLRTSDPSDIDASIAAGGRDGINFGGAQSSSSIRYAVVYGNGQGQPDSVLIYYADGGAPLGGPGAKPDMVTLSWGGAELTAGSGTISVVDDLTLKVGGFTGVKPTGYTSISGSGRGLVSVYGGAAGFDAVESSFDVYDGVGPVLANGVSGDGAVGSGPRIYDNPGGGAFDTLVITFSEEIRDIAGLKTLLYSAGPGEPPAGSPGTRLDVVGVSGAGPVYRAVVRSQGGGPSPEAGGWIRLDPEGASVVTDVAATQSGGVLRDNKPHANNRWAQLKVYEAAPTVRDAWYTGNSAAGKPDYAYVVFNKAVVVDDWFLGGAVNFGSSVSVTAGNIDDIFTVFGGDTLRVGLAAAAPSLTSSTAPVRTSGDIQFRLTYSPGKGWEGEPASGAARDKAKPVLAKGAVLRVGDGAYGRDTLVVYYSEPLDAESAGGAGGAPLTLRSKNGGYDAFQPELRLLGAVNYDRASSYYMARYLVVNAIPANQYPESGDSVHIYELAGIKDEFGNEQNESLNKWQPLTVVRYNIPSDPNDIRLSVTVSNNPLRVGGSERAEVVMAFNTGGLDVDAVIRVYDNRGNIVLAENASAIDVVTWSWDGYDKKGRLVDAGTYRFKAVCSVVINGRRISYTVEKSIGVAPGGGNSGVEAVAGSFTAGANPADRLSGGVGFFWDGVVIKSGALSVYDVSGNLVKRIAVSGEPEGALGRRKVGGWDLTDAKGRAVADGSYAVKGAIMSKDGKKRRVSAVVGVGR